MEFFQNIFTKEVWGPALSFASVLIVLIVLLSFPAVLPNNESKRRILTFLVSIFVGWLVMVSLINSLDDLMVSLVAGFLAMFTSAIILDRSRAMNAIATPLTRFASYGTNFAEKIGPRSALVLLALVAVPLIWLWQMVVK